MTSGPLLTTVIGVLAFAASPVSAQTPGTGSVPRPAEPSPAAPVAQAKTPERYDPDSFGIECRSGCGHGGPRSGGGTCIGKNCGTMDSAGGGLGASFYTRYLAGVLQQRVKDDPAVNRLVFQASFSITVEGKRVVVTRLVRSTGQPDLDVRLKAILEATKDLAPPPAGWTGQLREITVRGRRVV